MATTQRFWTPGMWPIPRTALINFVIHQHDTFPASTVVPVTLQKRSESSLTTRCYLSCGGLGYYIVPDVDSN